MCVSQCSCSSRRVGHKLKPTLAIITELASSPASATKDWCFPVFVFFQLVCQSDQESLLLSSYLILSWMEGLYHGKKFYVHHSVCVFICVIY